MSMVSSSKVSSGSICIHEKVEAEIHETMSEKWKKLYADAEKKAYDVREELKKIKFEKTPLKTMLEANIDGINQAIDW
jgi:hypothetical protein